MPGTGTATQRALPTCPQARIGDEREPRFARVDGAEVLVFDLRPREPWDMED